MINRTQDVDAQTLGAILRDGGDVGRTLRDMLDHGIDIENGVTPAFGAMSESLRRARLDVAGAVDRETRRMDVFDALPVRGRGVMTHADADRLEHTLKTQGPLVADELAFRLTKERCADPKRLDALIANYRAQLRESRASKKPSDQKVRDAWNALAVLETGSPAAPARAFHFPGEEYIGRVLAAYPLDPAEVPLFVAPFPIFILVNDAPRWREASVSKSEALRKSQLAPEEYDQHIGRTEMAPTEFLVDARSEPWIVYNRYAVRLHVNKPWYRQRMREAGWADAPMEEFIRRALEDHNDTDLHSGPHYFDPRTGKVDDEVDPVEVMDVVCTDSCDHSRHNDERCAFTGTRLARAFSFFANHAEVSAIYMIDPQRPPSRQARRASGYVEREHYRVGIRGRLTTLPRIAAEIMRNENVRERRPHDVRGHLRRYSSGRISPVRPHRRCKASAAPFIRRDYEVLPQPGVVTA